VIVYVFFVYLTSEVKLYLLCCVYVCMSLSRLTKKLWTDFEEFVVVRHGPTNNQILMAV